MAPPPPLLESFLHLLDRSIAQRPSQVALRWLDRGREVQTVTYEQLGRRVRATVRAHLSDAIKPGDRVLLVFEPGLEFVIAFIAVLAAHGVAVPVYPPNPKAMSRGLRVIATVARACDPRLALVSTAVGRLRKLTGSGRWPSLQYRSVRRAPTDAGPEAGPEPALLAGPALTELAFLQFTSGSTGDPKGVIVAHDNLAAQLRGISRSPLAQRCLQEGGSLSCVSWLPLYHDMGLVQNCMTPLCTGGTFTGMSPLDFLRDPLSWLDAVSAWKPTMLTCPNFAFELLLRKWDSARVATVDLSSVCWWQNAAEPVLRGTLTAFADRLSSAGIRWRPSCLAAAYGLAEAVVGVGQHPEPLEAASASNPDIVPSIHNDPREGLFPTICIVNPDTRAPSAPLEIGEIWLQHVLLPRGYWGQPELSEATFRATAPDLPGTWLRTGDLGWTEGDAIYISGRLKDLIIVRGRNVWPQDVERCVQEGDARVRPGCVIAFGWTDSARGTEQCVVVAEVRKSSEQEAGDMLPAIRAHLLREMQLEPHEIVLVRQGAVPKTTSGKVRRTQCRADWEAGNFVALSSWTGARVAAVVDWGWLDAWCAERGWSEARRAEWRETLIKYGLTSGEVPAGEQGLDSVQAAELLATVQPHVQDAEVTLSHVLGCTPLQLLEAADTGQLPHSAADGVAIESAPLATAMPRLPAWREGSCGTWGRATLEFIGEAALCSTLVAAAVPAAAWYNMSRRWDRPWGFGHTPVTDTAWVLQGLGVVWMYPAWMLGLCALVIVQKWLVWGRYSAGRVSWNTMAAARWNYVERLHSVLGLVVFPWVQDTVLAVVLYRLLGARVAWTAALRTPLKCPDLVTVGANAVVRGTLAPQQCLAQGVEMAPVTVGERVLVDERAVVHRGSTLARGSVLAPLTVVEAYSEIEEEDLRWHGCPCRRSGQVAAGSAVATMAAGARCFAELAKVAVLLIHPWLLALVSVVVLALWCEARGSLTFEARTPSELSFFMGATFVGFGASATAAALVAKWVLCGRASAGPSPLSWITRLRRWIVWRWHETACFVFLRFMEWPMAHWYLRMLGARVAGDALCITSDLVHPADADLVSLGHLSFVSRAVLRPLDEASQTRAHIDVAAEGEVGFEAVVEAGVRMGEHAMVGPHAHVLANTNIPSASIWLSSRSLLRVSARHSGAPNSGRYGLAIVSLLDSAMNLVALAVPWGLLWPAFYLAARAAEEAQSRTAAWILACCAVQIGALAAHAVALLLRVVPGCDGARGVVRSWPRWHRWPMWIWAQRLRGPWLLVLETLWAGSVHLNLHLRLGGARVPATAHIYSGRFPDPRGAILGAGSVVNEQALIAGHVHEKGCLRFGTVALGEGAVLETSASVFAAEALPERAVLVSRSKIMGKLNGPSEVYVGTPALPVRSSHSPRRTLFPVERSTASAIPMYSL